VTSRQLIVNADDLGLSSGVNLGIVEAHERGIVTSASLMVRQSAAGAAARDAASLPRLDVGLHIDLGEWFFADGEWHPRYERVDLADVDAVHDEVRAQLEVFSRLVGRTPTHIDSHQHVHAREPAAGAVSAIGSRLGVPVRLADPQVRYCGDFYGQSETGESYGERITPSFLASLIEALPQGTTELCCHPAAVVDFDTTYAVERPVELRTLCDPVVRRALERTDVRLVRREPA
jgi:chitin disaccharide deacetylase